MDYSLPGSSVHGIFQARTLEWIAIPFSRRIFPIQESNPGLLHCRQSLPLSHQGSPPNCVSAVDNSALRRPFFTLCQTLLHHTTSTKNSIRSFSEHVKFIGVQYTIIWFYRNSWKYILQIFHSELQISSPDLFWGQQLTRQRTQKMTEWHEQYISKGKTEKQSTPTLPLIASGPHKGRSHLMSFSAAMASTLTIKWLTDLYHHASTLSWILDSISNCLHHIFYIYILLIAHQNIFSSIYYNLISQVFPLLGSLFMVFPSIQSLKFSSVP